MTRGLLLAASVALALALTEAGLSFVAFDDHFFVPDEIRGWGLRPGMSGWAAEENAVRVQINSAGFRDRERQRAVHPGTVRIAVLGDSYMQAVIVPLEQAFPSQLERHLARCRSRPQVEVLNFGVIGYGTAQELLTYQRDVSRYRPAIVVLALYTENDIFDNSAVFSQAASPMFVRRGDELVLDDSFRGRLPAPSTDLWRRFYDYAIHEWRTASLLHSVRTRVRGRSPSGSAESPATGDGSAPWHTAEFREAAMYRTPVVPELVDAWSVTEALLLKTAAAVRADGAEFWVVTLTNPPQVDPDLDKRRQWERRFSVGSLRYPDRRIAAFGKAHGIPVVTLVDPLADYASTHRAYLHGGYRLPNGEGHWNELGHQLAAGVVGDRLCAESPAVSGRRPLVP